MNRILALACLAIGTWVCCATAAEDPVAILVAIKGRVEVASRGAAAHAPATLGRTLVRGDRVEVVGTGAATLFFNDGNLIELGERSSLAVGGHVKPKKSTTPDASGASVFKSISKSSIGGSRETGLVAMAQMRGSGPVVPLVMSPRSTQLLVDRPAFTWRDVAGATRYRVKVSGDAGEIWSREVADTVLVYPADAPPLPRGADLMWEVAALSDAGELRSDEGVFRVMPADEADRLRSQLARIQEAAGGPTNEACRYVSGTFLAANELYGEALVELQALVKLTPTEPGPHEALGQIYRAIGLPDLALAEIEKALELSRRP